MILRELPRTLDCFTSSRANTLTATFTSKGKSRDLSWSRDASKVNDGSSRSSSRLHHYIRWSRVNREKLDQKRPATSANGGTQHHFVPHHLLFTRNRVNAGIWIGSNTVSSVFANRSIGTSVTCDKSSILGTIIGSFERISFQMSPNAIARFMSTSHRNSTGTGQVIEDEDTNSLKKSIANKTIKVNACGALYNELSKTKPELFRDAPKNKGINFEINYFDSAELLAADIRPNAPVVCLLHGAPGKYQDFTSLINYLTSNGIRVIAPNFPDFSATYRYSFRHSPRERLDVLNKFFESIGVKKVDMMIGHSSAVYTIFELLDSGFSGEKVIEVKSLGLFSTPAYDLPASIAPNLVRLFFLKMFDYPVLRPIIMATIHLFVRLQGIQNRVDSNKVEDIAIAASAMGYSDSEKMRHRLELVHKLQIPTLLVLGCRDKLLPMKYFEILKQDLGVSDPGRQVRRYDENGKLVSGPIQMGGTVGIARVSEFITGGHYAFQRYSRQINEDVYTFLVNKVLKRSSTGETTKL